MPLNSWWRDRSKSVREWTPSTSFHPERELVLDVLGGVGVVGQLLVLVPPQFFGADTEPDVPRHPLLRPLGVGPLLLAGLDEVLHLHLLELAHPEDELARHDLIPERLADLGDAERDGLPRRLGDVLEVDEDALGRLGPEVELRRLLGERARGRLEHQVELADLGPVERARVGRPDLLGLDDPAQRGRGVVGVQRLDEPLAERVGVVGPPLLLQLVDGPLDELVGPVAAAARLVVDERVRERVDVARRLPDGRVHEDGRVEAHHVVVLPHHRVPPPLPHVPLELDAQRAVVVDGPQPAVDLGRREQEPAAFGEGDERVEVGHAGARGRRVVGPQDHRRDAGTRRTPVENRRPAASGA